MQQVRQIKLSNLLFIDIETVRSSEELEEDSQEYKVWEHKMGRVAEEKGMDLVEYYNDRAALYSEFGKIVCISVGRIRGERLVITTYKGDDERAILEGFMADLDEFVKARPQTQLVGHSVKGFDIPFIFRRSLVNFIVPNRLIDVAGLKPWEVTALDTKELWKGTANYNSSLLCVCHALGIPSPKEDISGADVSEVYYNEGAAGLDRIAQYCERDVLAVANLVKRFRFEDIFTGYEAAEPIEREPLGLVDRIANTGVITEQDKEEILKEAANLNTDEKQAQIKILKSALIVNKKEMPEDLELAILSA